MLSAGDLISGGCCNLTSDNRRYPWNRAYAGHLPPRRLDYESWLPHSQEHRQRDHQNVEVNRLDRELSNVAICRACGANGELRARFVYSRQHDSAGNAVVQRVDPICNGSILLRLLRDQCHRIPDTNRFTISACRKCRSGGYKM